MIKENIVKESIMKETHDNAHPSQHKRDYQQDNVTLVLFSNNLIMNLFMAITKK